MMSLDEETTQVFSNPVNRAYGDTYLAEVQQHIKDCWSGIAKGFLVMVIVATFHELLTRTAIAKVSFSGFEVKDLSIVRSLLPCIAAYYVYHTCAYYASEVRYSATYKSALRALYPDISASRLSAALESPGSPIAGWVDGKTSTKFAMILIIFALLGAPIYIVYAYVLQLVKFPLNVAVFIGIGVSLFFILYAIAIVVELSRSTELH